VVLLAGQSNATGAQSYAINSSTKTNYFADRWRNGADGSDQLAWEPWLVKPQRTKGWVSLDAPQISAFTPSSGRQIFGPEIGLARQLWADDGTSVSIIKAAYPGSSLAIDWSPTRKNGYFHQMVEFVRTVMSNDAVGGRFDVLGALYWYQGETDIVSLNWATAYQNNLSKFLAAAAKQLPFMNGLNVIIAKESQAAYIAWLRAQGPCPNCAAYLEGDTDVRAADDAVVASSTNVFEVDTLGLARATIGVHLTDRSELTLGEELARASEGSLGLVVGSGPLAQTSSVRALRSAQRDKRQWTLFTNLET
jgi:hypothetical protein